MYRTGKACKYLLYRKIKYMPVILEQSDGKCEQIGNISFKRQEYIYFPKESSVFCIHETIYLNI